MPYSRRVAVWLATQYELMRHVLHDFEPRHGDDPVALSETMRAAAQTDLLLS